MLEALAAMARTRPELLFVLGVDMAHVGRRYGDASPARAHEGAMREVAQRDNDRIERLQAGDAHGFWDLVRADGDDDLKWCGSSALYAFARAVPYDEAELLRYEQWNIDEESVVTFAGLAFRRRHAQDSRSLS
jgi:AmmeMemoRadiSam system protein B